jgi:hypothetical protein
MRTMKWIICAGIMTGATSALADTPPWRDCTTWERTAVGADPHSPVTLGARLSLAACLQSAMDDVQLTLDEPERFADGLAALEKSVAPVMAIYQDIAAHEAPNWRLMALFHEGQLFDVMTTRVRAAIPPPANWRADSAAYLGFMDLHRRIEPLLSPWLSRAQEGYQAALDIGRREPALVASDPVLTNFVADARQREDVLTRDRALSATRRPAPQS